jgi:hypothetical protein
LPDVLPPIDAGSSLTGPPSPRREAPPKHPHQQWQAYQNQLKQGSRAKSPRGEKKSKKLVKAPPKSRDASPHSPTRPQSMYGPLSQPQLPPRPPMRNQKSWDRNHQRQASWEDSQGWDERHQRQSSWEYAPQGQQTRQRPTSMFNPGQMPIPPSARPAHRSQPSFAESFYTASTEDDDESQYAEALEGESEGDEEVDDGDSEYSYEYVYTYEDEHGRRVEVTMDRPPGEDGSLPTPPPALPPPMRASRSQGTVHKHSASVPYQGPFRATPNTPSKKFKGHPQHFRSSSSVSQLSPIQLSQPKPTSSKKSTRSRSTHGEQHQHESEPAARHQRSPSNFTNPVPSHQRARSPSIASSSSSNLSSPRPATPLPDSPRLSSMSPLAGFDAFVGPPGPAAPLASPTVTNIEMTSPASSVSSLPMSPQYGIRDLPNRISGLPGPSTMSAASGAPLRQAPEDVEQRRPPRPTSATSTTSMSSGGFSSGSWVGIIAKEEGESQGQEIKGFAPRKGHARGQSMTMRIAAGEEFPVAVGLPVYFKESMY